MIKLKQKTVILVISLSLILPSIPVFYSTGEPAIEEVTPISFDELGSDYYNIRTNSFDPLTTSGELRLSFEGSAQLKVQLAETGSLDADKLDIRLEGGNWKSLSQSGWIPLGDFSESGEIVSYQLKFSPGEVTNPGSYYIGLQFSLAQTGGCDDPVLEIISDYLGPDEVLKVKLTSSCGPVGGADVVVSPGGSKSTNKNTGKTPSFGNLKPDDEIDLSIDTDGDNVKGLDGDLDLSLNLTFEGDLEAFVKGSIGPGEKLVTEIVDQDGDTVDTWTIYFDDGEGSDEIELEEEKEGEWEEEQIEGEVELEVEYEFEGEDDD